MKMTERLRTRHSTGDIYYYEDPLQSARFGDFPSTIIREFTFVDLDSDDDLDFVAVDDIGNVQYFENIGTAAEFHFSPTSFNRSTTFTHLRYRWHGLVGCADRQRRSVD